MGALTGTNDGATAVANRFERSARSLLLSPSAPTGAAAAAAAAPPPPPPPATDALFEGDVAGLLAPLLAPPLKDGDRDDADGDEAGACRCGTLSMSKSGMVP